MPLPKPEKGETQQDFMGRCINDDTMKREYPLKDQRVAVCYTQYRDNKVTK
jgi:hypothetical protein